MNKELAIIIKVKDEATKKLKEISWEVNNRAEKNKQAFTNMAAIGGAAFAWLTYWAKKSIDAAMVLESSLTWLKSIAEWTGNSFDQAQAFIEDFTKDWLIPVSDAASWLKNLMASWLSLDKASEMMERFKDSAAFWRQWSLSMWEAVRWATEWVKNQNSVMIDNSWVTRNLSLMWEDYALSIWKSVSQLTDAEKAEAAYQWVLKETTFQLWDAQKYSDTAAGAQARLNAQVLELQQSIWQALIPAFSMLLETIQPIIEKVTNRIAENPKLAWTIWIIAVAVAGLTATIWVFGLALPWIISLIQAVWAALVFLASNPIVLLIGAIVGLTVLIVKNREEIKAKTVEIFQSISSFFGEWWGWLSENTQAAIRILAWIMTLWRSEILRYTIQNREEIKTNIQTKLWTIKESVSSAITWIKDVFSSGISFLSVLWNSWRDAVVAVASSVWDTIASIFSSAFEAVKASAQNAIDFAVNKLNALIQKINSVTSKVWVNIWTIWASWQRAIWWPVTSNTPYLVWEKGPELFVPSSSGRILPNGWWQTVNINLWNVSINNSNDETRLVEKIKQAMVAEYKNYALWVY